MAFYFVAVSVCMFLTDLQNGKLILLKKQLNDY